MLREVLKLAGHEWIGPIGVAAQLKLRVISLISEFSAKHQDISGVLARAVVAFATTLEDCSSK
jgi:hypothetical protein